MDELKEATRLYSIQMTDEDRAKLKAIADHRGVTMAGALRKWIRTSYNNLTHIPGVK
jgi:predicted DNA-binding protein